MALRNIVMDGDPILKKVCRPVEKFDGKLATLLDDMGETMMENDGMGLAGPQVGIMRRVFVIVEESELQKLQAAERAAEEAAAAAEAAEGEGGEASAPVEPPELPEVDILEFVNPEIIEREGELLKYEGCLSFPGKYGAVARPARVKVRAQDRFGNTFEYEGEGMTARCLCHETDHLNGVTFDELVEYYYDPDEPHELDQTLFDDADESPGEEQ